MIPTNLSLSFLIFDSLVLDTVYRYHICKSLQGLHKVRRLKKGDFELYGTSRKTIYAEAIRTYILLLPLGKILELKDCYYIPNIIRNIISMPLLLKQGFKINIKNNGCSIYLSNDLFGMGKFINGLLILSLNDEVLLVENKRRRRDDTNESFL